ncbi:hypothetical protein Hanom_Chr00s020924g01760171 [Helianthus anomalus]
MSSGRYMAYSPSPSPHIVCLRSTATAIVEQQEYMIFLSLYLSELLSERNKLSPFVPVLPSCYRLLNQGDLKLKLELNYCASKEDGV